MHTCKGLGMSTEFLVDSQLQKGGGEFICCKESDYLGDTPLAVRVSWVREVIMCARDVEGATSELGDDGDFTVECGLWAYGTM